MAVVDDGGSFSPVYLIYSLGSRVEVAFQISVLKTKTLKWKKDVIHIIYIQCFTSSLKVPSQNGFLLEIQARKRSFPLYSSRSFR